MFFEDFYKDTRGGSKYFHSFPAEEKPVEKLYLKGAKSLNIHELLAIVIGSGNKESDVFQLAKVLDLAKSSGGLGYLKNIMPQELEGISGIAKFKAARICAAIEFGRRISSHCLVEKINYNTPEKIFEYMKAEVSDEEEEHLFCLYFNIKQQLIFKHRISSGGVSGTYVGAREIIKMALRLNATGIVLVHNHPSGDPSPSNEDISSTRRIQEACLSLNLSVLDHIIIGKEKFYSFTRHNLL